MSFRRLIIPTIVAIIVSIVATVVWSASPPPIITYQGKVLVSGSPASTTLPMQFIIYNHPTAGSVLYSASSTPIDIVPTNGLFTVYLGDNGTNPINPEIFKDNDSLYLQVVINGETLSPRKRLAATPYALNTKYLDGNFATSTPTTTKYIPIADVFGNFDLNSVTSTNLAVTGNITATGKISLGTSISDYTLNVGMSSGDLGAFGLFSDTNNYLVGFGNNTSSAGGLDNGSMTLYYNTNNIMNPQILFQASGTSWMSGGMVVGRQGGDSLEENEKLRIFGDINIVNDGVLKFNGVSGTPGYVLMVSTTTGLQEWAPTSSLGITGGGGSSLPSGTDGQTLYYNGDWQATDVFKISSTLFSVAAGRQNSASGLYSMVGGGSLNYATGMYSSVVGGRWNTSTENYSSIVGGSVNIASGTASFIGGGNNNSVLNSNAVVVGGNNNYNSGQNAFIGAGENNRTYGTVSFIGAGGGTGGPFGGGNTISEARGAFIGAGASNYIGKPPFAIYYPSSIVGGLGNRITEGYSFIGGGQSNMVTQEHAVVVGGLNNTSSGQYSFIGGGRNNIASGTYSSIAGGSYNIASGIHSFIGGGWGNSASATGSIAFGRFMRVNGENSLGINVSSAFSYVDLNQANTISLMGGNVGIGTTSPSSLLTIGNSAGFQVNNSGDLINIKGVSYIWPSTQGLSSTTLINDGSGNLVWGYASTSAASGAGGSDSQIQFNSSNVLAGDSNFIWDNVNKRLGIGTSTPLNALSVVGGINLASGTPSNTSSALYNVDGSLYWNGAEVGSGGGGLPAGSSTQIQFNDSDSFGATSTFVWDNANGRLGIGTSSPKENLTVVGNILQEQIKPKLVGQYVGENIYDVLNVSNVYISGKHAYITNYNWEQIRILDISNPAKPILVSTHDAEFNERPEEIYVSGNRAYIVAGSLKIFDVANPSNPIYLGTGYNTNKARGVYVSGKYAYIAQSNQYNVNIGGMDIIDISNPIETSVVGSFNAAQNSSKVYVSGNYAYLTSGLAGLKIVNISNPTNPIIASTTLVGVNVSDVVVSNNHAYVVDLVNGLKILDISNPSNPVLKGVFNTPRSAKSIFVSGKYAFIIDQSTSVVSSSLLVINISSSTNPLLAGEYEIKDIGWERVNDVFVSGRYAYVAAGENGLMVLDISGTEVSSLVAHSAEAGNLQIRNDLIVKGNTDLLSLTVGKGGLLSQGSISSNAGFSIASFVPSSTNNVLYNDYGTLYWNGISISLPSGSPGQTLYYDGSAWSAHNGIFYDTTFGYVGVNNFLPQFGLDVNGDINFTGDLYKNGVLFSTSSSGGTPAGSDGYIQFNNSGSFGATSSFFWDKVNGRLGIGTSAPTKSLHIQDGGMLVTKNIDVVLNIDPLYVVPMTTTLLWDPDKVAFRVGGIVYMGDLGPSPDIIDAWDDENLGLASVAFGANTLASGQMSFATGFNNRASGTSSVVFGNYSTSSGEGSFSAGSQNLASGDSATVFGRQNIASGLNAFAGGYLSVASGPTSFAFGAGIPILETNGVEASGLGAMALGTNVRVTGARSFALNVNPFVSTPVVSSTGVMVLLGGNVGVGTTTPTSLLTVAGDINIVGGSGGFKINGESISHWNKTGNNIYNNNTANVGIGTSSPLAKLHVHNGGLLITSGNGETPIEGPGTRLMWIPAKRAFRAGQVDNNEWDDGNIGTYSAAFGLNNVAAGIKSFSIGEENFSLGYASFVSGQYNTSSAGAAFSSIIGGAVNSISEASAAIIGGEQNVITGYSSLIGGSAISSISGQYSFIGGGTENNIISTSSFIAGGSNNNISGVSSFIGGGYANTVTSSASFIAGGANNIIGGTRSFIGSGINTKVYGNNATAFGSDMSVFGNASFGISLDYDGNYEIKDSSIMAIMGGEVGIGTTTPSSDFVVVGDTQLFGGFEVSPSSSSSTVKGWVSPDDGSWVNSSDENLKKNIIDFTGSLEKVKMLRPVSYEFKNEKDAGGTTHIGLLAQELEQIFPQAVSTNKDGLKGVSYANLTPILVQAIQEQQVQIDALKNASNTLTVENSGEQIVYTVDMGQDMLGRPLLNVASIVGVENKWEIDTTGLLKNKISTSEGDKEIYGLTSENIEITLSGNAQLQNGEAIIVFATSTAEIIDDSQPMKVSITLTSDEPIITFVKEKSARGFTVKQTGNGISGATFDWIVIAKRKFADPFVQEIISESEDDFSSPLQGEGEAEPLTETGDGGEVVTTTTTTSPQSSPSQGEEETPPTEEPGETIPPTEESSESTPPDEESAPLSEEPSEVALGE